MSEIKLMVFDMAGTTVRDDNEVATCIYNAAVKSGLEPEQSRIQELQGLPKKEVFEILWKEKIGEDHPEFKVAVANTYRLFQAILENHYRLNPVEPAEGAVDIFKWLRAQGIKIALTTGFYRKVANIILGKLGWDEGLDENHVGDELSFIDLSLTPDETGKGRPHPDMILKAMELLNIDDPKYVVKIGDTPSDLKAGKAAKCLLSLAVTNGSHSREQLMQYDNDGLLDNLAQLREFLPAKLKEKEKVKA
jgi:phosphonatase-like hydrolase